ncbi:MAG: hypothetical protein HZA77_03930 [Candidatus Schekmanbacteria bacterium]|nr:hypothetical protein [Candidatus Schekmanbacteria bacterium]
MAQQKRSMQSKVLRGIFFTLLGLTIVITFLSAAGTICAAFNTEKYKEMAPLIPYKPLYQAFVVIGFATGAWGISAMVSLVRGNPTAYRNTLWMLLVGALSAGVHMAVSQAVRGKAVPINIRFYVTAITLLAFLLLRIPPLREKTNFLDSSGSAGSGGPSAGIALIICSIITFTTKFWVGTTHFSLDGENWVSAFSLPLYIAGTGMLIAGIALLIPFRKPFIKAIKIQIADHLLRKEAEVKTIL